MKSESKFLYPVTVLLFFLLFFCASNIFAAEEHELYIAQGIEKLNQSRFEEAIQVLKKALELAPENQEAIYYAGVAYTRLGKLKQAEEMFLKILENDKSFENAYLELGRIYYIQSECDKTNEYLSTFVSLTDDDSMREYAGELLDECSAVKKAETKKGKERPYNLYMSLGAQYDDNVVLEPDNPAVPAETKSDGRVVAYIVASAEIMKKGNMKIKADYNFYQSLHFDLEDFDVHLHAINPYLEIDISDAIISKLGYSFTYTLLGGDRYSGVHSIDVNINVKEGGNLSTDFIYEYEDLEYWDSNLFQANSIRSGYQNSIGIKQNFEQKKYNGDIYLIGEFNRADVDYWSFNGYKLGGELTYNVTDPLYLTVSGEYNESRYRDDFPTFQRKRADELQKYSIVLSYRISDNMALYLSEDYFINDSNLALFDYKRNIIGLYLTAKIL